MQHLVYKTTHRESGKFYIGVHSTDNPNDGYLGSGRQLKIAIKQYGVDAFERVILHTFNTRTEAFNKERELVTQAFQLNEDTYNIAEGGSGRSGPSKASRTIMVYDAELILVKTFTMGIEAAKFLNSKSPIVVMACKNADNGKASQVKGFYVCYEGSTPVRKNFDFLRARNVDLAKQNTGKKRPAHSIRMKQVMNEQRGIKTVYKFIHASGLTFEGTQHQLRDAFPEHNIRPAHLGRVARQLSQSHRGWRID